MGVLSAFYERCDTQSYSTNVGAATFTNLALEGTRIAQANLGDVSGE